MSVCLVPFDTECDELADGSLLLRAHGELDLATASVLERALLDCARDHSTDTVVVDLADVPFIDASGLRVLREARRRQREADGELLISHPSRQVLRLLEIAGTRAELQIAAG
jgi:anti-sigma B factor antagonist